MSDWGKGATSSKKRDAPQKLEWRYKDLVCSKCGRVWMFRFFYDSNLKQVQDEYGNVLCQKCRREMDMVRKASPPSREQLEAVQVTMEDILKAKK